MNNPILKSWPEFDEKEEEAVVRVIRSNQLFADNEVKTFENKYSKFIGVEYSLGVGNATQGLHLALASLNIGVGDEVIVTPYSWISSASCILMQNAVPIFCDIESDNFGIDPNKLEKCITQRTKAVIAVHMFGYPCKIEEIKFICNQRNIFLIEDNSHAHGATVNSQKTGSFGIISVGSLHQRKSLPVGDGGIICTNNKEIYSKIYKLRSFGHEELSYNYRMTEFAGAIGQVRLNKLIIENETRILYAKRLAKIIDKSPYLEVIMPKESNKSVFYALLIKINSKTSKFNKEILELEKNNIPIRFTWKPLHKHSHFLPDQEIARGNPWDHTKYKEFNPNWSTPSLPVTESLIPFKILEFYIHPNNSFELLELAAKKLISIFNED